jgi:hypothetical protein
MLTACILSRPEHPSGILKDTEINKFLFSELIPGVAKRAVSHKTNNAIFANLLAQTLTDLVNLYNASLTGDAEWVIDMTDTMRYVLDMSKPFYQNHF